MRRRYRNGCILAVAQKNGVVPSAGTRHLRARRPDGPFRGIDRLPYKHAVASQPTVGSPNHRRRSSALRHDFFSDSCWGNTQAWLILKSLD